MFTLLSRSRSTSSALMRTEDGFAELILVGLDTIACIDTCIDALPVHGFGITMEGHAECVDHAKGDDKNLRNAKYLLSEPRIACRNIHNNRFLTFSYGSSHVPNRT